MKKLLALFIFAAVALPALAQGDIFVVRHAERINEKTDALSTKGLARADCLAATLHDVPIVTVIATQFKRTQQTAQPTAQEHKLSIVPIKADDFQKIASEAKSQALRGSVLVVGHGDTVPQIVKALTGQEVKIGAAQYDQLFAIRGNTLLQLHYCPASGPEPESRMMK